MITINFSPVNKPDTNLTIEWNDPVITVYGVDYDLSLLADGDSAEHDILKTSSRSGNDYEITVILPHGSNAPQSTRFPAPVEITTDGTVSIPVYDEVM